MAFLMGALTISHEDKSLLTIATWGGSLVFHSLLIIAALTFLTQVTPPPASKLLDWKVSLVTPTPSLELSERAQMVKHVPVPTTRSTASRPQPKRRLFQQRRIQQRQSSIHETAVVTRPTAQPTKSQLPTRNNVKYSPVSTQPLPNPVAEAKTSMVSTRQLMATYQPRAALPAPTKQEHAIQKKITQTSAAPRVLQTISSLTEAHSVQTVRESKATKAITAQLVKSRTSAPSVQTRNHHKPQKIAVTQQDSTTTSLNTSFKKFTKIASGQPQQHSEPSITRSHDTQQTTSVVKKRVVPAVKQTPIFAGTPNRHSTQKLHPQTQLTSITREAMKSRQKLHSTNNRVSNGLSKEVLAFFKLLREKIEKHRQYPRMAKRLGYQGTTTVSFALSHTGNLTLLKIAEPSGHAMLDEAALEAIQSISPLKPPMTIGGTPIEIPVAFELTR